VPFSQFKNDSVRLAREVLGELPRQIVEYFVNKGITPNPSKEAER
jgi:hypothetical protein